MIHARRLPRALFALGLVSILSGFVLAGCGSSTSPSGNPDAGVKVTVASKNDDDGQLNAEMYSLLLSAKGYSVTTKLMLGQTPVLDAAIKSGQIDIYPEFTGTALGVYKLPSTTNPQQAYSEAAAYYEQNFHITWLQPAYGLNDSYGLCTSQSKAQSLSLTTISSLVPQAPNLTLSGQPDFTDPQKGVFPPVEQAYGLHFKKIVNITEPLGFAAVQAGQVDINECYTTDPTIVTDNFVLLQDDKSAFPVYNPAPIVRDSVLHAHPDIATILNPLESHLTTAKIDTLIKDVSGGQSVHDVAQSFLKSEGLLS